jgi:hypothetical protein
VSDDDGLVYSALLASALAVLGAWYLRRCYRRGSVRDKHGLTYRAYDPVNYWFLMSFYGVMTLVMAGCAVAFIGLSLGYWQ